jgi:hypothetical protein
VKKTLLILAAAVLLFSIGGASTAHATMPVCPPQGCGSR